MSALPHESTANDLLAWALWAAGRGWHVHPLDHPSYPTCLQPWSPNHDPATCPAEERGKHPITKWSVRATIVRPVIEGDFGRGPRNIGIACGPSGLVVVDEDEPGALSRFADSLGEVVPETFSVQTGRGMHFYFTAPASNLGNAEGMLKGRHINVRGQGGYVVGPGSLHRTGIIYEPLDRDTAVVEMPGWLVDAIRDRPTAETGFGAELDDRFQGIFSGRRPAVIA